MTQMTVDLEHLRSLGATLHGLAGEANSLAGTSGQSGAGSGSGIERSVQAAASIAGEVVGGALIPGLRERLSETGDVMINSARQFEVQEDANSDALASVYTDATGDWNVTDR